MENEKLLEIYNKNEQFLITARRQKWNDLDNLPLFAKYYFPKIFENTTPDFHYEIYKLLKHTRVGIGAPRGFAKSTLVQKIYGIWLLLNREDTDILSISNSETLASEFVRFIKIELQTNDKLLRDYAELQWGDNISTKWTETHISINQGKRMFSQMRAKGRGCQVRGFRPTHILCDDLEDDEQVKSEDRRKDARQWFLSALLRTIKKEQQLVVIGTKLHPLALLVEILDKKDYFSDWETRTFRALETKKGKEVSIWEDRFPTKWLVGERKKDTYSFQSEYMNDPLAGTEQLFKKEWLDRAKNNYPKFLPQPKQLVIAIDPAISEAQYADNTAFCVMMLGDDGNAYEIETVAGKYGTWQFVEEFWKIYFRCQGMFPDLVPEVVIEEVAFQQVYRKLLQEDARSKSVFLNIRAVTLGQFTGKGMEKKSRDKFSRAISVTHFFEQDRIFIRTQDLYEELMLFPTGSRDDRVDACVYALNRLQRFAGHTSVSNPSTLISSGMLPNTVMHPKDITAWQSQIKSNKDWRLG